MTLPDDVLEHLLDTWPVARLATIRADSRPHLVPVVFARDGGVLWSPIDGKPKADREPVRVRNVRRDGRAGLLLDDYAGDWRMLWWIRVDATATIVRGEAMNGAAAVAAANALKRKYPQYGTVPLFHGRPTLIRLEPRTVRSWCAGPAAIVAIDQG